MRPNYFIFLFFVFIICASTYAQKATLDIRFFDSRDSTDFITMTGIVVFKNGKCFIEFDHNKKLTELDTGLYTINYKTIFNITRSVNIRIVDFKDYSLNLEANFFDYNKEHFKPIIDRLKNNESYEIEIQHQGCAPNRGYNHLIKIWKVNEKVFGNLFMYGTYSLDSIHYKDTITKELNTSDINAIRCFEMELNHMTSGSCTLTTDYIISYKNKKKEIADGNCMWNGILYLSDKIWNVK
ncbi:MAG: hypothetical protein ABIJ97_01275 [Bacteroidota bacterium]